MQICHDLTDCAVGQFRKQCQLLIVAASGGHIEHYYDKYSWCNTYTIILACFVVHIQNWNNKSKQPGLFCATLYIEVVTTNTKGAGQHTSLAEASIAPVFTTLISSRKGRQMKPIRLWKNFNDELSCIITDGL